MTKPVDTPPTTETPPAGTAKAVRDDLQVVTTSNAEAKFLASAAAQSGPMVQRLASHRDKIDLVVKELEGERYDLTARRDLVRRQAEAVEVGLTMHIEDIEATLALYAGGLNSLSGGQS